MKIKLNKNRTESGVIWLVVFVAIAIVVIVYGGCKAAKAAKDIHVHGQPEFTNDFVHSLENQQYTGDPKNGKEIILPVLVFVPFLVESTNLNPRIQSSTDLINWVDEDLDAEDVYYILNNPSAQTSPQMFFRGVVKP